MVEKPLVARLKEDAAQLRKMEKLAKFGGEETGVRVKDPALLLADLDEAVMALSARTAPDESELKPVACSVAVKALEWAEEYRADTYYRLVATTLIGTYLVSSEWARPTKDGIKTVVPFWRDPDDCCHDVETVVAAKAAAQADFEQRIRSALAAPRPSPDPVPMARDERHAAWAALRMVRDAVGELFGPRASIEGEEAVLLRGPEYHHEAEAIIEALGHLARPSPDSPEIEGLVERVCLTILSMPSRYGALVMRDEAIEAIRAAFTPANQGGPAR